MVLLEKCQTTCKHNLAEQLTLSCDEAAFFTLDSITSFSAGENGGQNQLISAKQYYKL